MGGIGRHVAARRLTRRRVRRMAAPGAPRRAPRRPHDAGEHVSGALARRRTAAARWRPSRAAHAWRRPRAARRARTRARGPRVGGEWRHRRRGRCRARPLRPSRHLRRRRVSGYVAVLSRRGGDVDAGLRARLASPLAPHGPHAAGEHREDGVGLAHALLRARENASCGPHRSPRGAWLVGDVRIDAQAALRDALAAAGEAVPRASPDESLVLAAWHVWGEDAAARLLGDFSFAIWDPARRVLFCARDAFGVRPLYYADAGDTFVFRNLLGAVRAHPAVSARLHEPAIVSFLCVGWNVDLTTTSFADVRRLP